MSEGREAAPQPSARRQETRERLFDAAMQVFAEVGLGGASVEAICTRAGFTRGAFYSNFSSKEQLFLALLEREFGQQIEQLVVKAAEIETQLQACDDGLAPDQTAGFVVEFLAPFNGHETWVALELELQLLAMRDPELIADRVDFKATLYRGIAHPIERIMAAADRRFTIPVEHALSALGGIYEDALRSSAMGGPRLDDSLDELGERIAELLFALTERVGDADAA